MNKHDTNQSKSERILIETDEFIFPIRTEKVLYAEFAEKQTIRLYESNSNYQLTDRKINIVNLLKQARFIRIQADLYINPKHVSEYKIKDNLVQFSTGKSIGVQPRYRKTLIAYFQQYYSLSH